MTKHPIHPAKTSFDLIIIGAGHAGCEAAMAASRLGLTTLLLTSNADRIGHLSCNPAIGGLGKGHMVKEIDALGGSMGYWTDAAAIQARTLNESKGPAVRATRVQVDRDHYMALVKKDIWSQNNLYIREDMAEEILHVDQRVQGIRTRLGQEFTSQHILITAGTFLQGAIHIGGHAQAGGRIGDHPSVGLSASLQRLNFTLKRFMTCTTPRLWGKSLNFSAMEPQFGDSPPPRFSRRLQERLPQLPCYMTWTTPATHQIIRDALHDSPMYSGAIPGTGPRYCPSIEDKIARFPEKDRHLVFVEPEGIAAAEYYPNGIPTGLPLPVQQKLVNSIPGLEEAYIVRPGYAIEYDVIDATSLFPTLESKNLKGLWFAGQINGTSGYEEAAAQGLWATTNIAAQIKGKKPFLLDRSQSYIAVLIDDLVTKGTDEPYRMFTSRAEHRLLLRESNADLRLTSLGRTYDLITDEQWLAHSTYTETLNRLLHLLDTTRITPNEALKDLFADLQENLPHKGMPLSELLRRPAVSYAHLCRLMPELEAFPEDARKEAETYCKYAGYVARQEELAKRMGKFDQIPLPPDLPYTTVAGLDLEAQEKLTAHRPATLGQASRIPGISPSATLCIEIYLKKSGLI